MSPKIILHFICMLLAMSMNALKNEINDQAQQAERLSRRVAVAIVGTGFAGLAAAVEASKYLSSDEKIVFIVKMATPGGNSVMNAGQIAAVGTDAQKLAGIQDSVDIMMNDMLKAGIDLNHPNLLCRMIE